jgi:pyruvate/2-oxoglutarate dehydrogenase complex dihydrolipoamide acyltransferase (E2) component
MLQRALVLSVLILVSVAATLPFGHSLASAGRRAVASRAGRSAHRRRSRAWWRRHRARLRRKRALAAARRRRSWALRRRRATAVATAAPRERRQRSPQTQLPGPDIRALLRPIKVDGGSPSAIESITRIEAKVLAPPKLADTAHAAAAPAPAPSPFPAPAPFVPAAPAPASAAAPRGPRAFSTLPVPRSWANVSSTAAGVMKFSVRTSDGRTAGTAVWSRVTMPQASTPERRNRTLGGVSLSALRRTVIDRMIAEGGWVVNDAEREIGGRRVFVVFAQSEGERGTRRSWTYYFTESGGQIFSLATTTPAELSDLVSADAEQALAALGAHAAEPAAARKN